MSERNFCERCGKRISALEWDIHTCTPPKAEQSEQPHIIEMAREAGFHISGQQAHSPYIEGSSLTHVLTRFAALVRAGASQPQQEPVAWIWKYANGEEEVVFVPPRHVDATHVDAPSTITPLYTSPPAQRKPLTDEEMWKLWNAEGNDAMNQQEAIAFARAIEAAHGIKGDA